MKNEWLAASQTKQTQMDTDLAGLRGEVNKWKAANGMTDAIAAELQIVGSSTPFDPESYKPSFTAEVFSGYVRIKFKRMGADSLILNACRPCRALIKLLKRLPQLPDNPLTMALSARMGF
jgi:hypothetical protein